MYRFENLENKKRRTVMRNVIFGIVFVLLVSVMLLCISCTKSTTDTPTTPADEQPAEKTMGACEQILYNWKKLIVGDPDENIEHSEVYNQRVKQISDSAVNIWNQIKEDVTLGYNIVYGESFSSEITEYYTKLFTLAKGWGTVGSEIYHNDEALADLIRGLENGYENYYGQEIINKGEYGNWYEWEIGTPRQLVQTLIIINDEISDEDAARYLACFDHLAPTPVYKYTACNKLWQCFCVFGASLVENDPARILESKSSFLETLEYVDKIKINKMNVTDGFYTDGSFIQHGCYSYGAAYGLAMVADLADIMIAFDDTRFEVTSAVVENQYNWVFESYEPIIFKNRVFAATDGRCIYVTEYQKFTEYMQTLLKMTLYAPEEYRTKIESLLRTYMILNEDDFTSIAPLQLVDYAYNLYRDDSVPIRESYNIFKSFGMINRVAYQNDDYAACVAFSSSTIGKYEVIGEANNRGWYQSDGALYVYTNDYDFGLTHLVLMNSLRVPGTTVTTVPRSTEPINAIFNSSDIAGGASGGEYGVALFKLGYTDNKEFTTGINANKSYFMFDNEIVCLGTDITEDAEYSVETVIENRFIRDGDTFTVNGEEITLTDTDTPVTAKYMHFSNMGGYVMANETELNVRRYDNQQSFLEIAQNHGVNPDSAEYAYILLPEASEEETKKYSDNPDITILAQEKELHIVKENNLDTVGYAFFAEGEGCGIKANAACAVFVKYEDGKAVVSISEITKTNDNLEITLKLGYDKIVEADENLTAEASDGSVTVHLDGTKKCGKTFSLTLGK